MDLLSYVEALPSAVLDHLYGNPWACMGIFRSLPYLSRIYIMRTLFAEQEIPDSVIAAWPTSQGRSEHERALVQLQRLRIWNEETLPGGRTSMTLNETFRSNLRKALSGASESAGGYWGPFSVPSAPPTQGSDRHVRDIAFLDKYAKERWESVLHYMVASPGAAAAVSRDVVILLHRAGLIVLKENSASQPSITPAGFQFLLLDSASQVWSLLLNYMDSNKSQLSDLAEILEFLLQLSLTTLGNDYTTEGLSQVQLTFLQHLREIGLVYQRKRKSKRFYPTRLGVKFLMATAINEENGGGDDLDELEEEKQPQQHDRFLVAETNYRLYAYTESALQIALVALFCDMQYRLPGLACGIITRESIGQALVNGITSKQIVNFLRTRAHPQMIRKRRRNNLPIVPSALTDQIRLWELERDRLRFSQGVLYNQFLTAHDFQLLRDYASDLGVLLWEHAQKRYVVVTKEGHNQVKQFWRRQKSD